MGTSNFTFQVHSSIVSVEYTALLQRFDAALKILSTVSITFHRAARWILLSNLSYELT